MSLVPAVHLAVLKAGKIYQTFSEAIREGRWAEGMPTNALLISGPSKTADIEQTLGLRSYDFYLSWPWAAKNQLTLGFISSLFENRIVSDSNAKRYLCRLGTDQLYGFWNRARSEWFRWRYSLQAGQAELSKDFLEMDVEPKQKTMEIKAGFGFILEKAKNYRFFVNTTWDLDLFKTRQWDGGSILLQFSF